MSTSTTEILEQILSLPPAERAELVNHILASLESAPNAEIERLWAAEAEERLDAYKRGEIESIAAKHIFDAKEK